jgi:hypothetical protein
VPDLILPRSCQLTRASILTQNRPRRPLGRGLRLRMGTSRRRFRGSALATPHPFGCNREAWP